ncbi:echinoderm microtubule-associated protein-like 6 [Rhopilema esculentum]|uniref:echinoderm microtubule-associated protein-like 6 n=1 Tax=Rhopilema esculentum TaxID=499914 RepID=UPI0031CF693D
MSARSRTTNMGAPGTKSKKKEVPWEKLMKEQTDFDNGQANLRTAKSDGLAFDQTMDDLGYSPKSSVTYSGVNDTKSLFDNSLQRGHTKPNFNLNESMNSLTLRQNRPPRSSPTAAAPFDATVRHSSPGRTSNGFHRTSPTLIRKNMNSFGPPDPQINPEIENAVISFCFIDLVDILRYSNNMVNTEILREMLRKDILVWLDAFSMYMTVICSAHPIRLHDLLKYQRNIIWIYRETEDTSAWWRYDIAFRRKAELRQIQDWSIIDRDLYGAASSERVREGFSCVPCLSNEHVLRKCPFGEGAKKGYPVIDLNGTIASNNEAMERALANPEKLLKKPNDGLKLKFAFGYHGYNACNNIFYTQSNEIVFHTAALGIVYSPKTHEQRFYSGHDDDVLCLTIHDDQDFVATGQIGKNPSTHVWDARSMKTVAILKGFHRRGIICVDFSGDGNMLADVGMDDDHCICVWDWRKQEKIASTRGHKDVIYNLEWNPYEVNLFVSVGVKHIKFWAVDGKKIVKRTATFGKAGELGDMLCVCHSPYEHLCYTGSSTGEIYVWQGSTFRKRMPAHKGPVYAMFALLQSDDKGFVSGGKDGVVVLWDEMFSQPLRAFQIETSKFPPGTILLHEKPPIRSLHTDEGRIVVGTGHDDVIQIFADGSMEMILQGHGEGELWGLAVHPREPECATVSDDKTLRIWSLSECQMKRVAVLRKGGRCLDYHPTGDTIAVGLNDGSFMIVDARSLQTLIHLKDRKEELSDIKFSPDGKFVAAASHDNMLDIYSVKRGKKCATCTGNSSYLTHFDWDKRGQMIQTNSGAREHLLFEAPSGKRKTMSIDAVARVDWATFTCVIGPTVRGIFPPMTDVTDVNATSRSKDYKLIASGDDFGQVKLFQYPVLQRGARPRVYKGHCSHVTNVRWTNDDKFLLSTGGMDASLLVWERIEIGPEDDDKPSERIQPKFLPSGTIKNPVSKGKPVWDD